MLPMPQITVGFAGLLLATGLAGFGWTGWIHVTALIPAFLGLLLLGCGLLAFREGMLKHAMHAAAVLGVVGFLGSAPGLLKLPALLSGQALERPAAVAARSVMALLCLVFLGLCVASFIQARRARRATG